MATTYQVDPDIENLCTTILATYGRTFSRAAALLPKVARSRVAVTYAFCRMVDDAVDEAPSSEKAHAAIAAIQADLACTHPEDPVVAAFCRIHQGTPVVRVAAQYLLAGVAEDTGNVMFDDDRQLLRYCYKVAGTPGLMMCPVIGVNEDCAFPFAIDLGIAMQLTNICRDIAEDARMRRVYLPVSRLQACGLDAGQILAGKASARQLLSVVEGMLQLADRYYESAEHGMRYIPLWPRLSILIASRLYRSIGRKILRNGVVSLNQRTVVSSWEKAVQLPGIVLEGLLSGLLPRFTQCPHVSELHWAIRDFPGTDGSASPQVFG